MSLILSDGLLTNLCKYCEGHKQSRSKAVQVREYWSELPVSFNYIGIENAEFQNFSENIGFFGNV
jgi:hypothetical protein